MYASGPPLRIGRSRIARPLAAGLFLTRSQGSPDLPRRAHAWQWASSFDRDIDGWDVGKVDYMHGMFYQASAYNQDISSWNVGQVTNITCT